MNVCRQEDLQSLRLFITAEHPCNYLPDHRARNLVVDPRAVNAGVYTQLAKFGFRRSGNHVYRPHCANCASCMSLRVPVMGFHPSRSQNRTWKKNLNLSVRCLEPSFRLDHYRLFERYLKSRHPGGGMDDTSYEDYLAFITSAWSDTRLYEFRLDRRLLMVAVVDRLGDGLSAVYTFFEPLETARSLGTYAILWQINEARRQDLRWVYLGYWVRDCQKMAYKIKFQPHELFAAGEWSALPAA
ncbi:MAG: arginyltransferase [Candidatus Competibacteraceae bacterium]|jgi:arginine-tRNA-protein transferase|nr:arginyltransferase [Candidatus Competibacteraceae bacterium]